jgi:hypothetical protein
MRSTSVADISDEEMIHAAVVCRGDSVPGQKPCGQVKISGDEYVRQLSRPDSLWMCPNCGSTADFDDEFFETLHGISEPEESPDELYNEVSRLVRVHGTDAVRGVCDALEAEARENG